MKNHLDPVYGDNRQNEPEPWLGRVCEWCGSLYLVACVRCTSRGLWQQGDAAVVGIEQRLRGRLARVLGREESYQAEQVEQGDAYG